ncbi:MAG: HPF/RaiA family ribosome-associated protein [Acidobacteria bacterium]|nr:HPF/RaiA family ribosome-associated protein [Acidobacteriota bacterium]
MKITYTGQVAFSPAQQKKLDARFGKLSKLLDRGGEKGARVILTTERHLLRAEITVHYYDHPLVVTEANTDATLAMMAALDKLERQIIKHRDRWRDTKRRPAAKSKVAEGTPLPASNGRKAAAKAVPVKSAKAAKIGSEDSPTKVFRVNHHASRKPMTMEEAMLDLDKRDYTVYRDATTDRVHVLVKRRDGHVDLIEG